MDDCKKIEEAGYLNGLIDLIFRANGKIFVLDWKSNKLGGSAESFGEMEMEKEMLIHHYVLQYHFYVVATHRFLSSRMRDYSYERNFGGVYYLFVTWNADRFPKRNLFRLAQSTDHKSVGGISYPENMSKEKKAENDWELFSLAEAISTFFSHRVEGEGGVALAALTREMTLKAGFGTSHIEAEKAEEIYHEWSSLPAVGSEEENQPLVRTEDGKLYFRRFFEYEQQVAMALSYRLGDNSNEFSDMIDEGVIKSLDELQIRAVKTALQRDLLLLTGGPGTGKNPNYCWDFSRPIAEKT